MDSWAQMQRVAALKAAPLPKADWNAILARFINVLREIIVVGTPN